MATIDDVYALLQTVNAKVDSLTTNLTAVNTTVGINRYFLESIGCMLSSIAPFAAFGQKWFVDGTYGSDDNEGSFFFPFATIAKAMSVANDGEGDVIFVFPKATPFTEQVVINKNAIILIGPGGGCILDPGAGATDHTVKITGARCVVSGFEQILGRNGHNAVRGTGAHYITIERGICKTDGTAGVDAVVIEESMAPVVGPKLSCSHSGRHGLVIKSSVVNCHWAHVLDVTAHMNEGDGIHLEGAEVEHAEVHNNHVYKNIGYGIYTSGDENLIVANDVHSNTAGDYYDATGTSIIDDNETSALAIITGVQELGVTPMTAFSPIVMEKGEKRVIVFEMTEDDVPVNCVGFTFQLGVKAKASDTAYKIGPISGSLSVGSTGLQSLVTFLFTPAMTAALTPFGGVYSVVLFDGSGNKVPLTARGGIRYTLMEDVIDV